MDVAEVIKKAIQEWVVPQLEALQGSVAEVRVALDLTNQRMGDLQLQLTDLSRRIDETNKRIDAVRSELTEQIIGVRSELTEQIIGVRSELTERIEDVRRDFIDRYDRLSARMDRLGEAIVRRDEYDRVLRHMEHRITSMEGTIEDLKRRIAA
ncbi:hypothetical protein [Deferrisoma camini]|uniref:hypothetical protein n=1 Tax=Deferrisoma camini TaxID=1035120 RepID=UPI00046D504E|nr:hypothetical protein [Deferrisoma camini]